jgi:hypothetical protein
MVTTELGFKVLRERYQSLIHITLFLHDVKEVICENDKEHFFDRIVIEDDKLQVYKYGLKKPYDFLSYDFTNDYARCLSYIEDSLYAMQRGGKPLHGMKIIFKKEDIKEEDMPLTAEILKKSGFTDCATAYETKKLGIAYRFLGEDGNISNSDLLITMNNNGTFLVRYRNNVVEGLRYVNELKQALRLFKCEDLVTLNLE